MWFSVDCTLIDNDTRHHSGQNVVDSRVSLSIRARTTLNRIRFVFYHNIKETKEIFIKICWQHYLYASDFPLKNFCKLTQHTETIRRNVWEKSNDAFFLLTSVQTTTNRISICFFTTISTSKKMFFLQSASCKRYCVTRWRQQRGMDSYLPRQISQSDCEISSNCGKECVQALLGKAKIPGTAYRAWAVE